MGFWSRLTGKNDQTTNSNNEVKRDYNLGDNKAYTEANRKDYRRALKIAAGAIAFASLLFFIIGVGALVTIAYYGTWATSAFAAILGGVSTGIGCVGLGLGVPGYYHWRKCIKDEVLATDGK